MEFLYKPLLGIAVNGASLYALMRIVPEITYTGGFKFFVLGGVILGLINFFVKPLIKLFSLPLVWFTGGLFLIVINVFVLWFLSYFLDTIAFREITLTFPNFGSYVIGAIVFGVINWTLHLVFK